jgi:hypothetical protein
MSRFYFVKIDELISSFVQSSCRANILIDFRGAYVDKFLIVEIIEII